MMTFSEYMAAVERDEYPSWPLVPAPPLFKNEAGQIVNLAWGKFAHLALIETHAGRVRSNHYHKTDSHFLTVVSGTMLYFWKEQGALKFIEVKLGETVFTPPLIPHATFFPTDGHIISISRRIRTHEEHESDLIRYPLVEVNDKGEPVPVSVSLS